MSTRWPRKSLSSGASPRSRRSPRRSGKQHGCCLRTWATGGKRTTRWAETESLGAPHEQRRKARVGRVLRGWLPVLQPEVPSEEIEERAGPGSHRNPPCNTRTTGRDDQSHLANGNYHDRADRHRSPGRNPAASAAAFLTSVGVDVGHRGCDVGAYRHG